MKSTDNVKSGFSAGAAYQGGALPTGGWIEIEAVAVQGLLTTVRPKVDQVYTVWHFYDVLKLTS